MVAVSLNNAMFASGGVKPEDDVEITAMAEKICETNQKVTIKLNTQLAAPNIMTSMRQKVAPAVKESPEDYASTLGKFGWTTIRDKNIPYLTRSDGGRYVCKRMLLKQRIFAPYLNVFTDEVHNCYRVQTAKVTKVEAELLNEINSEHCDRYYGKVRFGEKDVLILLDDFNKLMKFFEFCHSRLVKKTNDKQPCGFIKVSSENCVPYVCCGDITYVPLFYFEGDCAYLEERAIDLDGWELSHLKIACKLQGIRKELFDKPSLQVVDIELIKQIFAPGTTFDEAWLYENPTNHLVKVVLGPKPTPTMAQNQQHTQPNQQKNVPVTTIPVCSNTYANAQYSKNVSARGKSAIVTSQMPATTQVPYQNSYANRNSVANRRNIHPTPYPVTTTNTPKTINASAYISTANTNVYRNIAPNVSIGPSYNPATGYSIYPTSIENQPLNYCFNVEQSSSSPLVVTASTANIQFFQNM